MTNVLSSKEYPVDDCIEKGFMQVLMYYLTMFTSIDLLS